MFPHESMFLTRAELIALSGYRTRPAQVRALNQMGIEHTVRPDGKVVVLRTHVEKKLDGNSSIGRMNRKDQPDWSSFAKAAPAIK